jgi:hypothetical protein
MDPGENGILSMLENLRDSWHEYDNRSYGPSIDYLNI